MRLYIALVTAILFVLAGLVVFFLWDLSTERMDQIHTELEDKRDIRVAVDKHSEGNLVTQTDVLVTPVSGQVLNLSEVNDNVFASGALGKGFAVKPDENIVVSPVKAEILSVYPTGHVYTMRTEDGAELLVHIGINTVALNGKGFVKFVKAGDKVLAGQQIGAFDREVVAEAGLDDTVIVVVTNAAEYSEVNIISTGQHSSNTEVAKLVK
mgnify:CR=1 FL=1